MKKTVWVAALAAMVLTASAVAAPVARSISGLLPPEGQKLAGDATSDGYSRGLDFIGDINGDGFDDFAVGAPGVDVGAANAGAVYVYFGSGSQSAPAAMAPESLNGSNGFIVRGATSGFNALGVAVSAAGDFNNDGIDDFAIGAPTSAGSSAVHLIYGKTSFPAVINLDSPPSGYGFRISTGANSFGWSLASTRLNNDNFSDLIISQWGLNQGRAVVIFGQAAIPADINLQQVTRTSSPRGVFFNGFDTASRFGYSVRGLDDFNGDGIGDMLIGAPFADSERGKAYVIYGRADVDGDLGFATQEQVSGYNATHGIEFVGVTSVALTGGRLGTSVATGNVNGDAYMDLIIGAQTAAAAGRLTSGAVYVIFGAGAAPGDYTRDVALLISQGSGMGFSGAAAGEVTGTAVSSPGDVNGDAIDDLLISAHQAGGNSGKFYVIYGRPNWPTAPIDLATLDGTEGISWLGETAGDFLGFTLAQRGDFNNDGRADVLAGALAADAGAVPDTGAVYLILNNSGDLFRNGFETP
ncbi:MAG: integrin alpha [Lysobacterales bacterium]